MTVTMLPAVWALRDVVDVEALCRGVIRDLTGARSPDRTTRPGDWLEPCDYQVSLAFLLGETVVQEQRWIAKGLDAKPGDERGPIIFRPWLYQQLRSRLIDEWRSPRMFGRHGQHRVPHADDQVADGSSDDSGVADGDLRADRLPVAAGGDPADRDDADRWLYPDGDRGEDGQVGGLRRLPDPGATQRVDRAGVGARRQAGQSAAGTSPVAPPVRVLFELPESVAGGSGGLEEREAAA